MPPEKQQTGRRYTSCGGVALPLFEQQASAGATGRSSLSGLGEGTGHIHLLGDSKDSSPHKRTNGVSSRLDDPVFRTFNPLPNCAT